jgi:hypothetical protein
MGYNIVDLPYFTYSCKPIYLIVCKFYGYLFGQINSITYSHMMSYDLVMATMDADPKLLEGFFTVAW